MSPEIHTFIAENAPLILGGIALAIIAVVTYLGLED